MSNNENSEPRNEEDGAINAETVKAENETRPARRRSIYALAGAGVAAALLVGAAAGAVGMKFAHPYEEQALLPPIAITAMQDGNLVAVKGQTVEIFGNKFIVQDDTGRALVDTGREGEGGKLVAAGEAVTVQGRFEDGFLRASMLVHADGRVEELRPPHPPHDGPHGKGREGWNKGPREEPGVRP